MKSIGIILNTVINIQVSYRERDPCLQAVLNYKMLKKALLRRVAFKLSQHNS